MNSKAKNYREDRVRRLFKDEFTPERVDDLVEYLFHLETRKIEHPFVSIMDGLTDDELRVAINACALLESHRSNFGSQARMLLFAVPKLINAVGLDSIPGIASALKPAPYTTTDLDGLVEIAPIVIPKVGMDGFVRIVEMATRLGQLHSFGSLNVSMRFVELVGRLIYPPDCVDILSKIATATADITDAEENEKILGMTPELVRRFGIDGFMRIMLKADMTGVDFDFGSRGEALSRRRRFIEDVSKRLGGQEAFDLKELQKLMESYPD